MPWNNYCIKAETGKAGKAKLVKITCNVANQILMAWATNRVLLQTSRRSTGGSEILF